jgi:hypothetical protein
MGYKLLPLGRKYEVADDMCRADQKTAEDYGLEGGNTLHLVLALRGGR